MMKDTQQEDNRREILFRKFTIRKYPNHRKYVPHHRHHTMDHFEPHRDLIKQMQKAERLHQELSDKHEKRNTLATKAGLAEGMTLMMPVVVLARLEKKWASLALKLRKRIGAG